MLGQPIRRWADIVPTLRHHLVFAGNVSRIVLSCKIVATTTGLYRRCLIDTTMTQRPTLVTSGNSGFYLILCFNNLLWKNAG